uniref:Uncharacterized protein n=1 Tax=Strigamia maritima TaxID=126957 RepID=T1JC38_STRMM
MFNGSIPIVLDSLKQHYFIDRDGKMFRHVLNFLRTNHLAIPDTFDELELLIEEAQYYDIPAMTRSLEIFRRERLKRDALPTSTAIAVSSSERKRNHRQIDICSPTNSHTTDEDGDGDGGGGYECLALNISPDLGERIMLSGERALVDEIFPEISQALMDARSGVAWNQDARHVIRFPLNGYCKLNSMQAITRLLNYGFKIMASNGGGVEGQQFCEYLFCRKAIPMQ